MWEAHLLINRLWRRRENVRRGDEGHQSTNLAHSARRAKEGQGVKRNKFDCSSPMGLWAPDVSRGHRGRGNSDKKREQGSKKNKEGTKTTEEQALSKSLRPCRPREGGKKHGLPS